MTAPADTPPAPPDEEGLEPGEGGYPDEAQPCQLGGSHPAVRSLLFRDGDAYAPTCDDHAVEVRETLVEAGETIVGEVPIVAAIDDDPVTAAAPADAPEIVGPEQDGEIPLRFPVLVIEAADTSDGRFLEAGSLTHRALPIPLLAQPESAHGGNDAGPAGVVGRIDTLTRTPGPEVTSPRTGEPFPDGTFVWSATGVLSSTARVGGFDVADLFRRRFLRGVSVDLAGMDYEVIGGEDGMSIDPDHPRRQMVAHSAEISAATLVSIAAFSDAYAEIATDDMPADMPAIDPSVPADDFPKGLAASAFPAWRSVEVGDYPALVAAGEEHIGGMIALVPANADELAVDGGLPPDELHLTLAYLGDDVTGWPAARRDSLIQAMRAHAEGRGPIPARVMAHAQFNPDGGPDGDRDPCAVYLIGDSTEIGPLRSAVMTEVDEDEDLPEQHEPPIFHITAGYGVESGALTFTGPIVFDRIAVVLGPDWTYIPLGAEAAEPPASTDEETVMAAAPPDPADGLDDEPMETGMPDAPQPCPLGEGDEHPAVRSLLYAGGEQYVPTCREHEEEARGMVEAEGDEVSRVVEIREPDRLDAEEQEETS